MPPKRPLFYRLLAGGLAALAADTLGRARERIRRAHAPRPDSHRAGRAGERLAVRRLRAAGARILRRNYRCRYGEIDIIARDAARILFVEVKTRRHLETDAGPPVADEQRRRILRAAAFYLRSAGLAPETTPHRFDIAVCRRTVRGIELEHYHEAAFSPDSRP
jgi:putative endonuclease